MNEFDIIAKYFKPLTRGQAGVGGLQDDAAVLSVPDGHELVITSDTLNADTHFLKEEEPENVARKALRSNLSDLLSMGAKPYCYQLNLAFPQKPDEAWLSAFSQAMQEENECFDVFCSGGDTTSIKGGHLSISITALGTVPAGTALRRDGAKVGDILAITGYVGDAVLGLKAIQEGLNGYEAAIAQYRVPAQLRPNESADVRAYAHAAADVSDGLLADAMHIARASNVSLEVDLDAVPFSEDVRRAIEVGDITFEQAVKGGDDYVLLLAVPPENVVVLEKTVQDFYVIGRFKDGAPNCHLKSTHAHSINTAQPGWVHF